LVLDPGVRREDGSRISGLNSGGFGAPSHVVYPGTFWFILAQVIYPGMYYLPRRVLFTPARATLPVTPANAGVQEMHWDENKPVFWIPAFTGKTDQCALILQTFL